MEKIADVVYTWSWWGLIAGPVITLASSGAAFWSSHLRESFSEVREQSSAKMIGDLQESSRWRSLTSAQIEAMRAALSKSIGGRTDLQIGFAVASGDAEVNNFALELEQAFTMVGVKIRGLVYLPSSTVTDTNALSAIIVSFCAFPILPSSVLPDSDLS